MAEYGLECRGLKASYPDFKLEIDMKVEKGDFVCLIGPSGCGKSTTLELISGLLESQGGKVFCNGKDVSDLRPYQRNMGFVFQDYALFPNMNVKKNVGYSPRIHKEKKADIEAKVNELLEVCHLGDKAKSPINQLSGGQKQRVALARAIASQPDVLLLDEPLSALDAKLRCSLRSEVRSICKSFNLTTVYVTHDRQEAFALADKVFLMKDGSITMSGKPEEIYNKPNSLFAASFGGDGSILHVEDCFGIWKKGLYDELGLPDSGVVFFRPEKVTLYSPNQIRSNYFSSLVMEDAKVVSSEYQGDRYLVCALYKDHRILCYSKNKPLGGTVSLSVRVRDLLAYDKTSD